jgi:hypothetical protein
MLVSHSNRSVPVPVDALSKLFQILADENIRCVLLDACYSDVQAQAIVQHIECVIGIEGSIGESSAISFGQGFYAALAEGRALKKAFDIGCVQMSLKNQQGSAQPRIYARTGVDLARLFIT